MVFHTARTTSLRALAQNHASDPQPTPVEHTYLEAIAYVAARQEPVIAAKLARWFQVRPPTVTHVLQRLEHKQFIQRDQSDGIVLTATGAAIAERIIRRHRLLERFLFDVLQIPWHEVHREATRHPAAACCTLRTRTLFRIRMRSSTKPYTCETHPIRWLELPYWAGFWLGL